MGSMRAVEPYATSKGEHRFKVRFRIDSQGGPRQASRTFKSDPAAQEFARLLAEFGPAEACRILDERIGAAPETATLAAYAHHHIDTMTGVGAGYRRRCHRIIDNDMGPLGHLPLTSIAPAGVRRWVNSLEGQGLSGKTVKNKHGLLASIMKAALREHLIASNPCEGTRLPRTVREPMCFLTPAEYATFLTFFTPHWQPMVALMFGTGARFSELTALTVADVDLDAGLLSITKAWKDNGSRLGAPKSEKSVRTLSLAPETVEILRPLCEGRPGSALLLTNQRKGAVRGQTFHDNAWQPAVRLANGEAAAAGKRVARRRDATGAIIEPAKVPLGKRPRPHDARHSVASWLLASGAPLNVVQDHLGHESITTTTRVYGHLLPSSRAAIAGAMSAALTQAHPQIEG